MTEQSLSPDPRAAYDDHDEVALLLPWYVNGSLDADERALVERHCAICLTCRADLDVERRLAAAVAGADLAEAGMRQARTRLAARIDAADTPVDALTDRRDAVREARRASAHAPRWAVAAVLALAAGLVWQIAERGAPGTWQDGDFRTLARAPAGAKQARELVVVFAPDVGTEEAAALVADVDGYLLLRTVRPGVRHVRVRGAADDAVDLAAARLKATGRVLFAEPTVEPR
ncbi:MAG: zf-HC2 domain-containing protein [Gammaproteobacteria bacterium]